ncbi:MAG: succinate dehydrogenase, hydrophobic membrane anchor protein [Ignavibacteria bacterium]|nr:succinate dehydrogenase, hydrophobic membrane anchor protein [Ignavibacteria bacterium]
MYKHKNTQGSGSFSWVFQRVTGLILVVVMIGHYILMHYTPESGHTYDAVLARMQSNWYRVLDLTFIVLGMYHGLNGVWGIFRDYKLKSWQTITIISLLLVFGLAFTLWGIKTVLDIPYVQTSTSGLIGK